MEVKEMMMGIYLGLAHAPSQLVCSQRGGVGLQDPTRVTYSNNDKQVFLKTPDLLGSHSLE